MESSGMERTRRFLEACGTAGEILDLPSSPQRFSDGGQWRVEIPSVEGRTRCAPSSRAPMSWEYAVHRVSQGSGVMLLTDDELDEMREIAAERGIEVSLFVGPRAVGTPALWPTTAGGSSRPRCEAPIS